MGVRTAWKHVHDPFINITFSVSPRFGLLVEGADRLSSPIASALGFHPQNHRLDIESSPAYRRCTKAPESLSVNCVTASNLRTDFCASKFRSWSLVGKVGRAIRTGINAQRPDSEVDESTAAATAWHVFNSGSAGNCLPESLSRFSYLISAGSKPRLMVGVFPPTDTMHAWVELNDQVLGESEDTMVHYQTALAFWATS